MNPRAAALFVCSMARDTADARFLLTALGLLQCRALAWPDPGVLIPRSIRNIAATGYRGGTQ